MRDSAQINTRRSCGSSRPVRVESIGKGNCARATSGAARSASKGRIDTAPNVSTNPDAAITATRPARSRCCLGPMSRKRRRSDDRTNRDPLPWPPPFRRRPRRSKVIRIPTSADYRIGNAITRPRQAADPLTLASHRGFASRATCPLILLASPVAVGAMVQAATSGLLPIRWRRESS